MLDFGVLNAYNLNKIEFSQKWVGVSLTGPTKVGNFDFEERPRVEDFIIFLFLP